MGLKRTIARNAIWNWAGMGAAMLGGFVVMPFLIRKLGDTGYGLWILISSFTGYFGLLDLGVRSAVGRNLAFHRARGDQPAVNALLSTACALLFVPALLTILGTALGQPLFLVLFPDIPPEMVPVVRLVLVLIGVNLALYLLLSVFDATLWACQRFDVLNAIDITVTVLRVGTTFLLIHDRESLIPLAVITLGSTLLMGGAKAVASFRLVAGLRIAPGCIGRQAAGQLFGYGFWNFLLSVGHLVTNQIGPLIIGARLGLSLITPFTIAARLIGYAQALFTAGHGVLTPLATSLHATQEHDRQRRLFLVGSRYSLVMAAGLMLYLIFLGRAFITLWAGPHQADAHNLVIILALGELLPLSQGISQSLLLAQGRHRGLALMGLVENGLVLVLTGCLVLPLGLTGIAMGLAIPALLGRGAFRMVLACRCSEVPLGQFLRQAVAPAAAAVVAPGFVLAVLAGWRLPRSWPELIGYSLLYGFCLVAACAAVFHDGRELLGQMGYRLLGPIRKIARSRQP
jgi:O-antigen/teichoic acid export membrane protein